VLSEIGAADLPELIVVNKIDAADPAAVDRLLALYPGAVAVSALTGEGRHRLEDAIFDRLAVGKVELDLLFPYDSGDALATLHRVGEVTKTVHEDRGTLVHAKIPQHAAHRFSDFAIHG
jgi:GTP-binding protein HflX